MSLRTINPMHRHVLRYPLNDAVAMHAINSIARHLPKEEIIAAVLMWDTPSDAGDYLTFMLEEVICGRDDLTSITRDQLLTIVATDISSQIHLSCETLWPYFNPCYTTIGGTECTIAEIIIVRDMVLVDVSIEEPDPDVTQLRDDYASISWGTAPRTR